MARKVRLNPKKLKKLKKLKELKELEEENRHDEAVGNFLAKHGLHLPQTACAAPRQGEPEAREESDSDSDATQEAVQIYQSETSGEEYSHHIEGNFQIAKPRTEPGKPDPRVEIPAWGGCKPVVMALLAYLHPASDANPRVRRRFMRDLETISVHWWAERPGDGSPILNDTGDATRKRLERLRKAGNTVIVRTESGAWQLNDEAQNSVGDNKNLNWNMFDNTPQNPPRHFLWGLSDEELAKMVLIPLRAMRLELPSSEDLSEAINNVRNRPFHESLALAAEAIEANPGFAHELSSKLDSAPNGLTKILRMVASHIRFPRLRSSGKQRT